MQREVAVQTGLEVLLSEKVDLLIGKRVGVLAHPASVDRSLNHIVGLFYKHPEINLTVILGPQHGLRGETQDNMIEWNGYSDPVTGLPVFSLYGQTRSPTEEMMSFLDVLVVDLQDVGARYYTFIQTLALALQACRKFDKEMIVLDRPNPIGGVEVEGTVLEPEFSSFVGLYPLAVRHGMTIGELANYFNAEFGIESELKVVPIEGWSREMYFDDTGLPWVFPSPNMPSLETAIVYPGLCLLEGTNISEGRGTTLPFELSGAPWIDPGLLVAELDRMNLPGVAFRSVHFSPTFHKWAGHTIGGVQVHVSDRKIFRPFRTGIALVKLYRIFGGTHFEWKQPPYEYEDTLLPFDILCGTDQPRELIEAEEDVGRIEESWRKSLEAFCEVREEYLLY